jgi:hypothetical protein
MQSSQSVGLYMKKGTLARVISLVENNLKILDVGAKLILPPMVSVRDIIERYARFQI